MNEGFSEAAAYTTTVPEACDGWEDADGCDDGGDFEPHANIPASKPTTSTVRTKPARIPIRRIGQTLAGSHS